MLNGAEYTNALREMPRDVYLRLIELVNMESRVFDELIKVIDE